MARNLPNVSTKPTERAFSEVSTGRRAMPSQAGFGWPPPATLPRIRSPLAVTISMRTPFNGSTSPGFTTSRFTPEAMTF